MRRTKTMKNVRNFLKFMLVLSCIQLAFTIFCYSYNLYNNSRYVGDLLKVNSSYKLNNEQMNTLVESGYPNCVKRSFPKGTVLRTFIGWGYNKDKKLSRMYSDYNSGECVPKSIDYSYLVTAKSATGIILFLFEIAKILLIAAGIYLLHQILSNTLTKHPFVQHNSSKLKWIAYLLFGYAFGDWIYRDIIIDIINEASLGESVVLALNDESISFTILLMGFLVLIISSVFKYGYELKAENDLTI